MGESIEERERGCDGRIGAIRIDYDIPFDDFDTGYPIRLSQKIPSEVSEIYMRKSTGGNTHVMVVFLRGIFPLQSLFARAIMRDDSRRLRADMERFVLRTRDIEFCFSEKMNVSTGEILRSGEWMRIR